MAEHNDLGEMGEEEGLALLRKKNFKILETNWRYGKEEVDIIALDGDFLVFVEVKTRSSNSFGEPQEFVGKAKQRHLIRAANAYVDRKDIFKEIRFDIIAVTLHPEMRVVHIEDAFGA